MVVQNIVARIASPRFVNEDHYSSECPIIVANVQEDQSRISIPQSLDSRLERQSWIENIHPKRQQHDFLTIVTSQRLCVQMSNNLFATREIYLAINIGITQSRFSLLKLVVDKPWKDWLFSSKNQYLWCTLMIYTISWWKIEFGQ